MRHAVLVLFFCSPLAYAWNLGPIVDTHAHIDHQGEPGRVATALDNARIDMDRNGVTLTLLMPPPQPGNMRFLYDLDGLRLPEKHQSHFALIAGGGSLNTMIQDIAPERVTEHDKQRFRMRAESLLKAGIRAFGEIAVHHISHARMGNNHPYQTVPGDHPLLLLLADIAAENKVPIDLHFDIVPEDMERPAGPFNASTPTQLKANLPAFERLLAHNRKAAIVWAHAGSDPLRRRSAELQATLLQQHPNLYASLRVGLGGPHASFIATEDGGLRPEWRQVLMDFPDRFVVGSDSFHPVFLNSRRTPAEALDRTRRLLEQLPEKAAQAIASENAFRLYSLNSKTADNRAISR